jgi:exonuclease III
MTGITTYLSVLKFNVNGLNSPSKGNVWWTGLKRKIQQFVAYKTHLTDRNKHRLNMKCWKKIYQASGPRKQAGVAILISDKVDIKPTLIKWDEEHPIVTKGEVDEKEIAIIDQ